MTIKDLEPKELWSNFYALTQCPRPSKHEEKVREYIVEWAKKNKIECRVDKVGNIILSKPASKGMEKVRPVVLQAHMDMVPQARAGKKFDFQKDPIKTKIVDGWVYADDTTLGADNGLGVAAIMAVFASKTAKHGPLEALITTDEETGMTGAFGLKKGELHGDYLINLDSETEGELYVGCAGGIDANISFKYKEEPMPKGFKALKIVVTGLRGGHSGMEINEGRGNANKVMARLLLPILRDNKGKLASFNGGNMRNAIPREAEAVVAVPAEKVEAVKAGVEKTAATVKAELAPIDPGLVITVEGIRCGKVIAGNTGLKLVKALYACPNAVDRMSLEVEGLVETSNNLAIVHTDKGVINVNTLLRGSTDTLKMDLAESVRAAFELAGAKVWFDGAYSGWSPNMASPILHTMKDQYKKLFGKEPAVMAIHAGLECGILAGAYPNWDMISCGPTLKSPHSPDERCYVPSVAKWWQFIQAVIEDAPKK